MNDNITGIGITKTAEETFRITYMRKGMASLQKEQIDVIRFMDEAIDAMLRCKNTITSLDDVVLITTEPRV